MFGQENIKLVSENLKQMELDLFFMEEEQEAIKVADGQLTLF